MTVSDQLGISIEIGVEIFKKEIFKEEKFIMEIFRDDTKKTRTIFIPDEEISLETMEDCIEIFKARIDWDFMDKKNVSNNCYTFTPSNCQARRAS